MCVVSVVSWQRSIYDKEVAPRLVDVFKASSGLRQEHVEPQWTTVE